MSEITSKLKPLITIHNRLLSLRLPTVSSQRQYAKPHGRYIDFRANPLYRKEDQAQLESEELSKMSVLPVIPPGPHESCSIYHDPLVNKMIQHVMEMGKKQLARSLVEKGFENIKRTQIERYHLAATPEEKANVELDPKVILRRAVENCKPLLMMSPVRRGGITYQVPGPITDKRSLFLAIKWLLEATNEKERTVHFPEKFAWEVLDAANNTGSAVKRKQELHRQCEANRAYAHYRW